MQRSTQRAIPAPWSPFGSLPLPLRPRGRTEALARGLLRLEALREEMVAKTIAELDAINPDPDLEDDGTAENSDPREENDPAEDSLGSLHCIDQRRWAKGRSGDFKGEHDGREPVDHDL